MFLGISIHQNEITAATHDEAGKITLVSVDGSGMGTSKSKVYIDGNYAYLGIAVALVLAHNPKLPISNTVGLLAAKEEYKDAQGTIWTTAEQLALFFKQLDATILQDAIAIRNVVITTSRPLKAGHVKIIRKAAALAEFTSCAIVDMIEVIKEAHQLSLKTTKRMLHIQLDETAVHCTLGELGSDESYHELQRSTDAENGMHTLITNLQELLQNEYQKMGDHQAQNVPPSIKNQRNQAKQLLQAYVGADQPYLKMRSRFQRPQIELKIPRIKVRELVDGYVKAITGILPQFTPIDIIFYSGEIDIEKPLTGYFAEHSPNTVVYTENAHTVLARGAAIMASQKAKHTVPEDTTEQKRKVAEMNINKEFKSVLI